MRNVKDRPEKCMLCGEKIIYMDFYNHYDYCSSISYAEGITFTNMNNNITLNNVK